MPSFGEKSLKHLNTCDEQLQTLFKEVIKTYDCAVICGHRNQKDQDAAFEFGTSKLKWPDSQHNKLPSRAVDVAPYPINWADKNRFYHFAGYVLATANRLGIKIRWGGDWDMNNLFTEKFVDLPHFELVEEK